MTKTLTAKGVEALKAGPRYEVKDGRVPGMAVVVGPKGPRSWVLRYRRHLDERLVKMTLGKVYLGDDAPEPKLGGPLTLAGARRIGLEQLTLVDLGRDPAAEKRDETAEHRRQMKDTFGAVLEAYFTKAVPLKKRRRNAETTRRLIEKDTKAWKDRPIRSITRRDVRELLDGVVGRGSPVMANNLRALLSPVFNWAVERELVDANPVAQVARPAEHVERERILDDRELVEVWRAAETLGGPWEPLAKLLILTGQRLGEVEAMRFEDLTDLDGNAPTWRIPAEVTKNEMEHRVPLSDTAVEVLRGQIKARRLMAEEAKTEERRRLVQSVPYVFWGGRVARDGTITKLSGRTRFRERWREAVDDARREVDEDLPAMPDWRPHDLRRTAVSGMARLGVPIHVAEIVVNHRPAQSLKGVARVYNRYDYAPEQRHALAAWADHVEALVDDKGGEKVVVLRGV